MTIGNDIHRLATELWPINRSITGDGVRLTLEILKRKLPNLTIYEVPTGTQVFDWVVPKEWKVKEAWIKDPNEIKPGNIMSREGLIYTQDELALTDGQIAALVAYLQSLR